jgi:hypothetical protein
VNYGLHIWLEGQLPVQGPPSATEGVGLESAPISMTVPTIASRMFFMGENSFYGMTDRDTVTENG